MRFKNEFNSLIINGLWNPNIFTQEWVGKYLLPQEELHSEFPLNLIGIGSPKVSNKSVSIFVIANKLFFTALNTKTDTYNKIQSLAMKVADYLPHTPVNAYGTNFSVECQLSEIKKNLLSFPDAKIILEHGYLLKNTDFKHLIDIEDSVLTLSVSPKKESVVFDFNYHYIIDDLIDFKGKIFNHQIFRLKDISEKLMNEIFIENPETKNGK